MSGELYRYLAHVLINGISLEVVNQSTFGQFLLISG